MLPNTFCRYWVQWFIREKDPCGEILIRVCPSSGFHARGTPRKWSSVVVTNWSPWPTSVSELLNSQCAECFKPSERELALDLQGWWRLMGREKSLFWSGKYFFFFFFGRWRRGEARLTPGTRYKTAPPSAFWLNSGFFRGKAFFAAYIVNNSSQEKIFHSYRICDNAERRSSLIVVRSVMPERGGSWSLWRYWVPSYEMFLPPLWLNWQRTVPGRA